jgi:hypothetical protein
MVAKLCGTRSTLLTSLSCIGTGGRRLKPFSRVHVHHVSPSAHLTSLSSPISKMTVILARALLLGQLVLAAAALHDEPRAAVADRGFPSGSTTCWVSELPRGWNMRHCKWCKWATLTSPVELSTRDQWLGVELQNRRGGLCDMPVSRVDHVSSLPPRTEQSRTTQPGFINRYNIPFPPGGTLTCHYFAEFGTLYENPSGPQCQMVPQVGRGSRSRSDDGDVGLD